MKKYRYLGIALTLSLLLVAGCDEKKKVDDYNTDKPIELAKKGDIDSVTFNLYSIEEGKNKQATQINLLTYQHYDEKSMATFMKGYIKSLETLNKDVSKLRVDVYHISASQLDVINDDSLLEENSAAQLTWVYEDEKLYPQYKSTATNEKTDAKKSTENADNVDELMNAETGNLNLYEDLSEDKQ